MIIKRQNDRSPETAFVAYRNVGAVSITQNDAMCYLISGASVTSGSGNFNAVQPVTAHLQGFGGIARSTVAVNGTGLATAYGYHASVKTSQMGSVTMAAGEVIVAVTATGGMNSLGGATFGPVHAAYAIISKAMSATSMSNTAGATYHDDVTVRAL